MTADNILQNMASVVFVENKRKWVWCDTRDMEVVQALNDQS